MEEPGHGALEHANHGHALICREHSVHEHAAAWHRSRVATANGRRTPTHRRQTEAIEARVAVDRPTAAIRQRRLCAHHRRRLARAHALSHYFVLRRLRRPLLSL